MNNGTGVAREHQLPSGANSVSGSHNPTAEANSGPQFTATFGLHDSGPSIAAEQANPFEGVGLPKVPRAEPRYLETAGNLEQAETSTAKKTIYGVGYGLAGFFLMLGGANMPHYDPPKSKEDKKEPKEEKDNAPAAKKTELPADILQVPPKPQEEEKVYFTGQFGSESRSHTASKTSVDFEKVKQS